VADDSKTIGYDKGTAAIGACRLSTRADFAAATGFFFKTVRAPIFPVQRRKLMDQTTNAISSLLAAAFQAFADAAAQRLSDTAFAEAKSKMAAGYRQGVALELIGEGEMTAEFLLIAPSGADVVTVCTLDIHALPTALNS
jgi:hypothetical protein